MLSNIHIHHKLNQAKLDKALEALSKIVKDDKLLARLQEEMHLECTKRTKTKDQ